MAVKTRIPMEKIMAVKKKLQKLPAKETGKTREEALEILAGDFQEALKKGYSVKEIREILGEEGVRLALAGLAKAEKSNMFQFNSLYLQSAWRISPGRQKVSSEMSRAARTILLLVEVATAAVDILRRLELE